MKKLIFTTILCLILLLLVITPSRAVSLSQRLSGKILLQVQEHGEAWYIYPDDLKRYYLGRPADAFRIMRELGLGISERDYNSFGGYAPGRLSGKILLRVEANGEAYYVNPDDLKIHYLGRPADAFGIMRELGLGITNIDLEKIPTTQEEVEEVPKVGEEPTEPAEEKDQLNTLLPTIENYPKLKQVYKDMYGVDGYSEDEVEFMKVILDVYKERPKLKDYSIDVLYYFAYRFPWRYTDPTSAYNNDFFENTIRKQALELIGDNDLGTAKNTYVWVGSFLIEEGTIYSRNTLERIWEYKDGSCENRSIVMLALLRSVGIPAREVASDEISHSWVEIYYNDEWIPIPSTGVLDEDKDNLVDLRDRITEDVLIRAYVKPSVRGNYYGKYIGYKYSLYHIKKILNFATDQNYKEFSQEYINKWEKTSSWKEREEFGQKAMIYAVASLTGKENAVYMANELTSFVTAKKSHDFPLEPDVVILAMYDSQGLEWGDWLYDRNQYSVLSMLIENINKKIAIIFINEEVIFMDNDDVKTLLEFGKEFTGLVPEVLVKFSDAIKNVQDGEKDKVEVILPQADYYISGTGPVTEDGYEYAAMIVAKKEIKSLEFEFNESGDLNIRTRHFKNIMFKDNNNELLIEVNDKGYFEKCPSYLRIPFDQTLLIQSEGDYIVIKGDMSLEE